MHTKRLFFCLAVDFKYDCSDEEMASAVEALMDTVTKGFEYQIVDDGSWFYVRTDDAIIELVGECIEGER